MSRLQLGWTRLSRVTVADVGFTTSLTTAALTAALPCTLVTMSNYDIYQGSTVFLRSLPNLSSSDSLPKPNINRSKRLSPAQRSTHLHHASASAHSRSI